MGYSNNRKKDKLPPFVPLTWELLNSPAYKELSHSAAKALPFFLGKVKISPRRTDRYDQEFHFSYGEGKKLGFATATFSRVIKGLVALGFIDPVDRGGLRGDSKSYNIFKLSRRWEAHGKPEFKSISWEKFLPRTV